MPKTRKPELYNLLKATGAPLSTTYIQYTTADLEAELTALGVDFAGVNTVAPVATKVEEPMPPFRLWSFLTRLLPRR